MARIGFVGAGQMGRPMVERLLAAGHDLTVFARRAEVRAELAALDARVVETAREAAAAGDVVLACLFSDAQLVEVSAGDDGVLAGLAPGSVLASHVTGTVRTIRELAAQAAARGAFVVDAPVSGTPVEIRAGRLTVLLGGPAEAAQQVGQAVAAYADPVLTTGALGSALSVKLVNNLLFSAHVQLAAAAVDLGRQLDIEPDLLLRALGACSGASYATNLFARVGDPDTIAATAGPFLRKDVAACEQELDATGASAELLLDVVRRGPLPLTS